MREDLRLLLMMPWKHKVILCFLIALNILLCVWSHDFILIQIKGMLVSSILIMGAYFDFQSRIIPDWINVLILLAGLINIQPLESLAGFVLCPLPLLIMALIVNDSIGGGDIKIVAALGFANGIENTVVVLIMSLIFAILFTLLYYQMKRERSSLYFPFVPYVYLSWISAQIIS